MRRAYPVLREARVALRWRGKVALTPDHLPHIHEPEPGLIAVAGCQGRGVALMIALGERLAAYCAIRDASALPLPITPIRPIPFHRFHQFGVAAAIAWKRALDATDRR
jgi:glycine/D-amino acid oxidase-like deaminating enzyme